VRAQQQLDQLQDLLADATTGENWTMSSGR
jgi:hypothetical protein